MQAEEAELKALSDKFMEDNKQAGPSDSCTQSLVGDLLTQSSLSSAPRWVSARPALLSVCDFSRFSALLLGRSGQTSSWDKKISQQFQVGEGLQNGGNDCDIDILRRICWIYHSKVAQTGLRIQMYMELQCPAYKTRLLL